VLPGECARCDYSIEMPTVRTRQSAGRAGDPNGKGLPSWPAFKSTTGRVLYFGDPITVGEVSDIGSLTVLDALYASVRGSPATN